MKSGHVSARVAPPANVEKTPHPDFLSFPRTCSVLGVPFSWGQPIEGTDMGPKLMRDRGLNDQLRSLEWRIREDVDVELCVPEADHPESTVRNGYAVGQTCHRLYSQFKDCAEHGDFVLTLGGDHSIGVGTVAGALAARPDTAVIWVDAHADLNTLDISPSGNAHGMPLAFLMHLMDPGSVPGFEWMIQENVPVLKPEQVVYVGLRDVDILERRLVHQTGIRSFTMHDVDGHGIGEVMRQALAHVEGRPIHMSYDIDAVDPDFAPSTGTVVRGGLSYREALYVAEAVAASGKLASLDMVEVNPSLGLGPDADLTADLANLVTCSAMGSRIL